MMMKIASLLLAVLASVSNAAPLADLVEYLPEYGRPPTPQFSGYLDATAGCDTAKNGNGCYLHYWLAMADEDFLNKPTILWLNGGPGSSSILGFLTELGPLLMNAKGGLMKNPYSWTKVANVFALEAPVGVGYSYCARQKDEGKICVNTDKFTASASRAAMVDFFTNKFPELAHNDFFIVGESYAGVYIPTLTKEILDNAPSVPLKGIAVGDPCTDNTAQADSMDSLWYGFKNGLVDEQTFDLLWNKCNVRSPNLMTRGGKHLVAAQLNEKLKTRKEEILQANKEQQLGEEELRNKLKEYAEELWMEVKVTTNRKRHNHHGKDESPECRLAQRKYLLSTSGGLSQGWSDLFIDDYSLFAPVSNKEDDDMAAWMMRPDVRKALHVEDSPSQTWPGADVGFDYSKEYDACNWGGDIPPGTWSMIDFYRDVVPRLKVTYVYNGDTDPCVSYEGTRTAIKRVGFSELDGGAYRPWFYNQTGTCIKVLAEKAPLFGPGLLAQDMGPQFAGEIVSYEHNLSFLTFHGSGHMVPQFVPQSALHMVDKLVHYKDLSPLLQNNQTITDMSDDDYEKYMNQWTESAQAAPYVTEVAWKQKPGEENDDHSAWEEFAQTYSSTK